MVKGAGLKNPSRRSSSVRIRHVALNQIGAEMNFEDSLKEASRRAIEETFALNLPITTIEGDAIVKKYANGHAEFVKKIEHPSVKIEKRIYKIK